jgi:sortase (surface protein transpeptidase)
VSYVVAPDRPKFLSISKLGIENARIVALGLKDNNQIRNPDNIRDVGWYAGSKKPGEKGAVFVYGHLSDTTQDGIFIRLHELDPGDSIVVTLGDNSQLTYLVKEQRRYQTDAVDMDSVLRSIDGYDEGLQLMTCAGSYDKNIDEFSERLVVFAVRK